jgi:hypothetical protein
MYTRNIFVALSTVLISDVQCLRGFAALDYEHFSIPQVDTSKLENRVFTTDGFDPTIELTRVAEEDEHKLAEGKAKMDKEFTEIQNMAANGGPTKLKDLQSYVPHIRKLDVGPTTL